MPQVTNNAFDIFVSYHGKSLHQVEKLYNTLIETYRLNVWVDYNQVKENENAFYKVKDGIQNSTVFMLCLTKEYAEDENCLIEFNLAIKAFKKQLLVVFLQRLDFHDVPRISNNLNETVRFDIYRAHIYDRGLWLRSSFVNKLKIMLKKPIYSRSELSVHSLKDGDIKEDDERLKTPEVGTVPEIRIKNCLNKILHHPAKQNITFIVKPTDLKLKAVH